MLYVLYRQNSLFLVQIFKIINSKKSLIFLILGEDRNFALEDYGHGSKCFEHGESMWEERSCGQVNIKIAR